MTHRDPANPRVERPRVEPEIIPPNARQDRQPGGSFENIFIRVEEGDDGIRRFTLKRPGPFTIALMLLGAGLAVAIMMVLLAGLVLLWIPPIVGVLFALFSGRARNALSSVSGWWRGGR
jgi:hypothetical protein